MLYLGALILALAFMAIALVISGAVFGQVAVWKRNFANCFYAGRYAKLDELINPSMPPMLPPPLPVPPPLPGNF
jgi:hypothetical protein